MATPTIDFNQYVVNALPPTKRKKNFIAWLQGLSSQAVRLYNIFYSYMNGSQAIAWSSATTYAIDDETVYNFKVYKSMVAGNLNNNPETNTYNSVTNQSGKWQLILDTFIGTLERSRYNSQKLTMEWALNRYFKKQLTDNGFIGFKQPNSPISPTPSDIYISNVTPAVVSFLSFTTEVGTANGLSFTDGASAVSFTNTTFSGATTYQFNVNIPAAVFTSINSDTTIAANIVRSFLDKLVPAGIFYNIVTY